MTGRPDERLRRRQRLSRPQDFTESFETGRKYVGRLMVLYIREGDGAALRLGVVTSRKVGGAVIRNRARRRLRECFRRQRHLLKKGDRDVVIVARAAAAKASWGQMFEEMSKLFRDAGLTNE